MKWKIDDVRKNKFQLKKNWDSQIVEQFIAVTTLYSFAMLLSLL